MQLVQVFLAATLSKLRDSCNFHGDDVGMVKGTGRWGKVSIGGRCVGEPRRVSVSVGLRVISQPFLVAHNFVPKHGFALSALQASRGHFHFHSQTVINFISLPSTSGAFNLQVNNPR
jgi:hypothetical protein